MLLEHRQACSGKEGEADDMPIDDIAWRARKGALVARRRQSQRELKRPEILVLALAVGASFEPRGPTAAMENRQTH